MQRAFYWVILVQFCSALADNALLIVCIARLGELDAALWLIPVLKLCFTLSYVFLAPFVGPVADAWTKGHVMLGANGLKAAAALLLMLGSNPILTMALAGLGAALYGPAKYGLITELVAGEDLVRANGYIEGSTVCAVILGTLVGGFLVSPWMRQFVLPEVVADVLGLQSTLGGGMLCVLALYIVAALLNGAIEDSGVRYARADFHPLRMIRSFVRDNKVLWSDPLGRLSMGVTTLLWGIGTTLQLLILRWGAQALGLGLDKTAYLQGVTAVGIVLGAGLASRCVSLANATRLLPLGVLLGLVVPLLMWVHSSAMAAVLLVLFGAIAGFFVVPMNALLQHRGHLLLTSGRSIAVQGFNENAGMLTMLALYAVCSAAEVPINVLLWSLGTLVASAMLLIMLAQHRQRTLKSISSSGLDYP